MEVCHCMKKICEECGKEYEAKTSRQRFCPGPHKQVCVICGKEFEYTTTPREKPHTCCMQCKMEYMKRRNLEKYGVESVSQIPEIIEAKKRNKASSLEKIKATNLIKYGHEWAVQSPVVRAHLSEAQRSPEVRRKNQQTYQSKYGVDHIFKSREFRDKYHCDDVISTPEVKAKIRKTFQSIYGVDNASQVPGVAEKAQKTRESTMMKRYGTKHLFTSDSFVQHIKTDFGVDNVSQNPEVRSRVAKSTKCILACDGTIVESHYEKLVYDFCVRNHLNFIYQPVQIDYQYQGSRRTFIDFCIDGVLFEIKGGHLMHDMYEKVEVPISAKLEVYKKNHVVVITDKDASDMFGKPNSTESNGFKYENKCPNPLIGVDIELFKPNPDFPYREDRPHCFYDVRVDGQKSSHEAFYDEGIRWKMIMNRIQYSGGFIDGKQVLNALNITRTCKQPSWFSRTLAREILSKYSTSDTIVDCFAGWGAREQATHDLKKWYIGIDLNSDLVKWHHEQGRGDIALGDARTFRYDKECTIFICPPYSDPKTGRCFEDYNFDGFTERAKALTQCEWLKIVMDNCPNFKEAIMVCKIVDPGWEQYIVDTKKNKSHFGVNNEYVLVVPGRN